MNLLSRLWNHLADSVAIKTADRLFFQTERSRLLSSALTCIEPGISEHTTVTSQLIVSLTTHTNRLHEAWLPIESIMQGSVRPNRILLWLDERTKDQPLPVTLQRQQSRGLEIRYTEDLGPFTKLIPALREFPDAIIVTIDDDMLYPYDTLELLVNSYLQHPDCISANRVVGIEKSEDGHLRPLASWKEITDKSRISPLNFFEGVCGALYPSHCFNSEVFRQTVFSSICPTADDIWFNCMALLNHTSIVSANAHYSTFPLWVNESVQDSALWRLNHSGKVAANDQQLLAVLSHYHLSYD